MKKTLSLLLMLAMIFAIGGCITDNGDDDDNGDNGGIVEGSHEPIAETYFPLADGMKWTYVVGENYGSGVTRSTLTRTIDGTIDFENHTWAQMKDSSGQSASYRIEDDIVYMIGNVFMAKPALENVSAKVAYNYGFQSVMFDVNKSYGEPWTVFTNFWDSEELQLNEIMTGEYIGLDDAVIVVAGQYFFCRKYIFKYESVQNERHTGRDTVVWLAPNVGIIKMTKVYSDSGESFRTVTYDLTDFETGE